MRRLGLAAALAAALQCTPYGTPPADVSVEPTVTASPARPRLVLLLVIDQLPSWSFDAQRDALDGGIARLLARGRYWPHARYPYAATHTAPGHATIGTGAPPSVHGVVANRWFDAATDTTRDIDEDPTARLLDPRGGSPRTPAPGNPKLEVDGIAEALHAGHRGSTAIAIGLKARAAGHVIGKHPDLALWFDGNSGALTTSTAFADALPPWVLAFAEAHPRAEVLAQSWRAADPQRLAALAGGPDDRPGESDPFGLGTTFPHDLARATDPAKAFAFTPMASTLLADAAIAAIADAGLGDDASPDLLAVSFSAHDYAGHAWCQESWERVDHLLQLDRDIGRLLDALDRKLGADGYAVVLTSDHGATPSIALSKDGGRRVLAEELRAAASEAATRVLGPGRWIAAAGVLGVSTSAELAAQPTVHRDAAIAAIVTALEAVPGIDFAALIDTLAGDCDARPEPDALVCRSSFAGRSNTIYAAAKAGSLLDEDELGCTAHGSPQLHDREVPLLVVAPGLEVGPVDAEVSMLQVAPTIAALLGVAPPPAAAAPSLVH